MPVLKFRRRKKHFSLSDNFGLIALFVFSAGILLWQSPVGDAVAARFENARSNDVAIAQPAALRMPPRTVRFTICGAGPRINCVVDGDTFYLEREKIRIADINAPEVGQPKCSAEAELGRQSTLRLLVVLNAGPIELRRSGRDKDKYGRSLRTVHRGDQSIGGMLVDEGLAHVWRGRKEDWCGRA